MTKYMYEIGVICGRFQVFHNDHLKYMLKAKERCKSLIIGITSPDISTTIKEAKDLNRGKKSSNPCTSYERMQIIKGTLKENNVSSEDYDIVPFPIEKPELLCSYIPKEAVCIFTVYDEWGIEKVNRLSNLGYKTDILWTSNDKGLSSTYIRHLILENKSWKQFVPKATYEYFIQHHIDERIRNMML